MGKKQNNKTKNNTETFCAYGNIIHQGARCYFLDSHGRVYDVKQDSLAEELSESDNICLCTVSQEVNQNGVVLWSFANIDKVMGNSYDPIPNGMAIAESYGLVHTFSNSSQEQLKNIPDSLRPVDYENRRDLRDIPFITIDPDNAKDYDDAVYGEKLDDGSYILMVAIADVEHYVPKGSPLNREAMKIGNSSYLGATVYPMHPEKLSNGICSLNEGVDRLVMCTTAHIDPSGEILDYTIEPAVINSRHRLTYKQADYIELDKMPDVGTLQTKGLKGATADIHESLHNLFEISNILENEKSRRGTITISSRKAKFILDDTGTIVEDVDKDHNEISTKVIESTAVLTNEIWADASKRMGIDFVYRNHGEVDDSAIRTMNLRLSLFGLHLPPKPNSKNIQRLLADVRGKKCEEAVSNIILRGLGCAQYSSENKGHLGLGVTAPIGNEAKLDANDALNNLDDARREYLKCTGSIYGLKFIGGFTHSGYGHTTSPIRRFSDDIEHAQMKGMIYKGKPAYTHDEIDNITDSINKSERNSAMAENEYDMMLATLWAKDYIGEKFECVVVDVSVGEVIVSNKMNIKFVVPFSELNGKFYSGKGSKKNSRAEGDNRPRIKLGDSIMVTIDEVSTRPYKVYATQKTKGMVADMTGEQNEDEVVEECNQLNN